MIAPGTDFARMTDLALSSIRLYGEKDPDVAIRLLDVLVEVAAVLPRHNGRREVLCGHLVEIAEGARRGIQSAMKRAQVEQHLKRTAGALGVPALRLPVEGAAA